MSILCWISTALRPYRYLGLTYIIRVPDRTCVRSYDCDDCI